MNQDPDYFHLRQTSPRTELGLPGYSTYNQCWYFNPFTCIYGTVMPQKRTLCFTDGHVLPTMKSPVIWSLVMPQLCWTVFAVHSTYTIFWKSALPLVFRQLVIGQIYIFYRFLVIPQCSLYVQYTEYSGNMLLWKVLRWLVITIWADIYSSWFLFQH
jgi:hypothetical protein